GRAQVDAARWQRIGDRRFVLEAHGQRADQGADVVSEERRDPVIVGHWVERTRTVPGEPGAAHDAEDLMVLVVDDTATRRPAVPVRTNDLEPHAGERTPAAGAEHPP